MSPCQEENPSHARFCFGCGACLALACGSCGTEVPVGARFCLQCGEAVAASTAAPRSSPAPETYTPKHLTEKILTSKAALEGDASSACSLRQRFPDCPFARIASSRGPYDLLLDKISGHAIMPAHRLRGELWQSY